jgi:hypothetical protein
MHRAGDDCTTPSFAARCTRRLSVTEPMRFQLGDRVRYTEKALAAFTPGYREMMRGAYGTIRRDQGTGYFAVLWDGRDDGSGALLGHRSTSGTQSNAKSLTGSRCYRVNRRIPAWRVDYVLQRLRASLERGGIVGDRRAALDRRHAGLAEAPPQHAVDLHHREPEIVADLLLRHWQRADARVGDRGDTRDEIDHLALSSCTRISVLYLCPNNAPGPFSGNAKQGKVEAENPVLI